MTKTALKVGKVVEVWVPCSACNGKGQNTRKITMIKKSALEHHKAEHTNRKSNLGVYLDQGCDCPRITRRQTTKCIKCGGSGQALSRSRVPQSGERVIVKDQKLLKAIFGEEDIPQDPGKVFDVQGPDQHHLELATGVGVRVTWDRLTKDGRIPKGQQVELWTFDLSELRLVN